MTLRLLFAAGWLLLTACRAGAATWPVAPGQQGLAQALAQAVDGDVIELAAGEYNGEVGTIHQKRLTLRGVGGRVVLHAAGRSAEGKAILVVRGGDILIENLEFRGARVADRNGAGIRFERGHLLVRGCVFVDNENGILAANTPDAELEIEDSQFAQAPADTPLPHLIYAGAIAKLSVTGSRFSGGRDGHLIKSRAKQTLIRYNMLVDGPGGQAAYELDLPNGGLAWVIGNVIGQSATTSNPAIVSYGAEGYGDREHGLFFAHNTLINDAARPAGFLRIAPAPQPVPRRIVNNLFIGSGDTGGADPAQGNVSAARTVLRNPDGGAFELMTGSALRGQGVPPGSGNGMSVQPTAEFSLPAGTKALTAPKRWSPGAFQR